MNFLSKLGAMLLAIIIIPLFFFGGVIFTALSTIGSLVVIGGLVIFVLIAIAKESPKPDDTDV